MRDVISVSYDDMSPELRALIAYEHNGALDNPEPQAAIARVLAETPVVRWERGVGFFSMEDVREAGRNPALVSTNPDTGIPMGMGSEEPLIPLHLDGDLHRHYRKLLDPMFSPQRMAQLEPQIRDLADDLIDEFVGNGEVELNAAFCVPLPCTIFLQLFGMPLEDLDLLDGMKDRILKNEGRTREEREEIGIVVGREMDAHLAMRLEERQSTGERHADLLDQFIHFEVDGHRLSDADVVNLMHMFTIAGLDTVKSSLSCVFAWLARHPDVRRNVVADPARLPALMEELMRFESPVPSSGARWAREDTEVNGVSVKRGELVYLCWASANLDPTVFEGPIDVEPERSANRHIAFASGFHRCLGSHLARAEMRASIDQFHTRIPEYEVTPGDEIEYEVTGVRQAKRIPLTFCAR